MIELWMVQHLQHRAHRAGFGIVGAIDEPLEARMHGRAGAHGTGLQGYKEFTVRQAVITGRQSCLAERYHFGMGGGVRSQQILVATAAHNPALANYDRTDGNLARRLRPYGLP